jgi:hypothetical protein
MNIDQIVDELGINGLFLKLNMNFKRISIGIDKIGFGYIGKDFDFGSSPSDNTPYYIEYVHKGMTESKYIKFNFKLKNLRGYKGNENQFCLYFNNDTVVVLEKDGLYPLYIDINADESNFAITDKHKWKT